MRQDILLYGATGYTGKLIAELAMQMNLRITLAGRSAAKLEHLSNQTGFAYEAVSLDDSTALNKILSQHKVVIHAAGPFSNTATQMIEACLRTSTHYVDITGEIEVFELAKQYNRASMTAGIVLMPGAGFDVVPTDCLALYLRNKLPDATHLKIAFTTKDGGLSHGTASTMVNGLGRTGMERKEGRLVPVPLGKYSMNVDFGDFKSFVMSIPWGDVSTAFHTTGIPNIRTYTGVSKKAFQLLKIQGLFNWILRTKPVRSIIQNVVDKKLVGPDKDQRSKAVSYVWAEVCNEKDRLQATLSGPDGYTMTSYTSLIIAQKLCTQELNPGYHTPAELFGEDLILEVPGVSRKDS